MEYFTSKRPNTEKVDTFDFSEAFNTSSTIFLNPC